MDPVSHWDDIERFDGDHGPMGAMWTEIDGVRIGACRIEVTPGRQATPVHVHDAEEELFFVLGGSGLYYEHEHGAFPIAAGDFVWAPPSFAAHTMIGGDDGLDVIAFG